MKIFRAKYLITGLLILALAVVSYFYRGDLLRFGEQLIGRSQPCQKPITYSLGDIDPRFGLTQKQILGYVERAEKVWEAPFNKQLFEYSPTGSLKINFIYDDRQKATDALKKLGFALNDDRATYDALKNKYDQLVFSFNSEKARLDAMIISYNSDKAAYEKDVAFWNTKGGAPKKEYDTLQQQRSALNDRAAAINNAQSALNASVENINSTAVVLNKLIALLNLQVAKYNTISTSNGQEFSEAIYAEDATGTKIDIYEFNNTDQLVRLLAHELGHALSLEHLANPAAIMYYLNEGTNEKLTPDDLTALNAACGIK